MAMLNKPDTVNISLHKVYAEDGLELDSLLFEPKQKTKKIIIHLHGKEGHFIQNHFVTYMGYSYPLRGYSFLTFNNRGHDYMADMLKKASHGFEWSTRGSAFEVVEESIFDINGIINYVKELGYEEVILQGHSLGCHKICYYLNTNPKHKIERIILLTTADVRYQFNASVPNWEEYSGVAKQMISDGHGDMLMPLKLWSNAPISAKSYWHYTNPDSNTWCFNFSSPELGFKNFDKIKQKILVVVPENDIATGISQVKAMDLLKTNTSSNNFKSVIVKNAVHNFSSKEEELVETVISWLK